MTTQLNFFNQPPEIELKGSALDGTITDVRTRGGFVSGLKIGPRNADYTLRVQWGEAEFEVNQRREEIAI